MAFPAHGALQHNLLCTVFLISAGTWTHAGKTDRNVRATTTAATIAASGIGEYA